MFPRRLKKLQNAEVLAVRSQPSLQQLGGNAVASPLNTVGSHRTPSDGAHFEYAKNKRRRSAIARCSNKSAVGSVGPEPRSKVSYNAPGAPRARITHTRVTVQTHWSFVTLHGDCFALMRQFACLLVNPITLDNFAAVFNCTPMDRASDALMARTKQYSDQLIGTGTLSSVVGPPDELLLLHISSYVVWQTRDLHLSRCIC